MRRKLSRFKGGGSEDDKEKSVSDLICRNKRRGCYALLSRFTSAGNADSWRGSAILKAGVAKKGKKVADYGTAEKCRVLRGVATVKRALWDIFRRIYD